MIEFQNVTFTYHSTERESGVYNLNLTIPDGQVVLLCGESGCGKTTLTRLINGLTPEYYEGKLDGVVLVNGKDTVKTPLYELSKAVGSVFQNPRSQFFNVDTTGEIAFGCENIGLPKEEIYRRIGQVTGELTAEAVDGLPRIRSASSGCCTGPDHRAGKHKSLRAAADAENRTPLNIHGKSLLSGNAYCGHCGAKLELTSSRKWRKLADGSLDDTLRVRYTCYGKLRKQTNCTGQTGYTVHILDEIIDKAVRQIFSKMRGIPKEQIVTKRYEKENTERKNHLQDLQTQRNKAEKDLFALKTEVLACIKGESVLPRETLAEMITAQEEKLTELENLYEAASEELEKTAELMDKVSRLYDELISYADLYDSANFEAKKMIVNQLIRRVDVYRGYQINISFNFDLTPYIEGE